MRTKSKADTEKFYSGLLAEAERSGRQLKAIAEEHGMPPNRLSWWRRELRRRAEGSTSSSRGSSPAPTPSFLPVHVVDHGQRPSEVLGGPTYEVVFQSGRVLRIPADFDDARVAALVRAVGASC